MTSTTYSEDDSLVRHAAHLQVNVDPMPEGPDNPEGNGFVASETDFVTESQAQRSVDAARARMWKVKNPNSLHPTTGAPTRHERLLHQSG